MSDAQNDPLVRRAIDDLRRLPPVDPAAMRRVVEAAAAARLAGADDDAPPARAPVRGRWLLRAGMLAAALVLGFFLRGEWTPRNGAEPAATAGTPASIAVRPVTNSANELLPIPEQFVFSSAKAHRVSVVGDFNKWNSAAAPMSRSSDGRMWSATVPVLPGRHSYGFMIDDSLFVLDPAAPKARDADLGSDISVLVVGRP